MFVINYINTLFFLHVHRYFCHLLTEHWLYKWVHQIQISTVLSNLIQPPMAPPVI